MTTASAQAAPPTVGGWLAGRTPPPPELLRTRIMVALGDARDRDVADTERVCLEAAERVLARLLEEGGTDRRQAADLLAADALVTYALEFAAHDAGRFEEQATRAMARFGRLRETRS